jgi:SRSO17 transposase
VSACSSSTEKILSSGVGDDVDVTEVAAWAEGLTELHRRIAPRFARSEPRERVGQYVQGLLAPLERKNGWTLAEAAGEARPAGMQRILVGADWDPDLVRDDVRDYVVEHLGDPGAVLVFDDTGFLKKGTRSAGVQRQYSGTAGRVENCQIGVFLGYATPAGRTFLDRELYLPTSWTDDRDRCREAGVPDEVGFATKPELAMGVLERALDAGVPASWVTADEAYGQVYRFRALLEDRGMSYVVAVPCNQRVHPGPAAGGGHDVRADEAIARLVPQAWTTVSVGAGAKGPRVYQWARTPVRPLAGPGYWLLARRSLADPTEVAYYLCSAPARTPLRELARIAGTRWAIEETFQTAKGEVGLDHYQVRRYDGWYRHITLAMLAHAFLTATRAAAQKNDHSPSPS